MRYSKTTNSNRTYLSVYPTTRQGNPVQACCCLYLKRVVACIFRLYMGNYEGVSSGVFDEPEYRDTTEMLVAIYVMTHRDQAGVCPVREKNLAVACRTSSKKIRKILDYFESIDKLIIGENRNHIWWKSGIFHTLYRGKFSPQQLKNVVTVVKKWHSAKIFGENFSEAVSQHYDNKYNIVIPYTANTTPIPTSIPKTNTTPIEETKTPPAERFEKWINKKENLDDIVKIVEILTGTSGEFVENFIETEYKKMEVWLLSEPVKGNKKNWKSFMGKWLKRSWEQKGLLQNNLSSEDENKHYKQHKRAGTVNDDLI